MIKINIKRIITKVITVAKQSYRGVIGLAALATIIYVIFGRLQKLSAINSAIISSALAVLSGFLLDKLVFQSVIAVREARQNLAERFIFYAYVWGNPGAVKDKRQTDAQEAIREASTLLRSRIHSTPLYFIFWLTGLLPYKKNALKACKVAIGVSNGLAVSSHLKQNLKDIEKIEKLLNVDIYAEDERPPTSR